MAPFPQGPLAPDLGVVSRWRRWALDFRARNQPFQWLAGEFPGDGKSQKGSDTRRPVAIARRRAGALQDARLRRGQGGAGVRGNAGRSTVLRIAAPDALCRRVPLPWDFRATTCCGFQAGQAHARGPPGPPQAARESGRRGTALRAKALHPRPRGNERSKRPEADLAAWLTFDMATPDLEKTLYRQTR